MEQIFWIVKHCVLCAAMSDVGRLGLQVRLNCPIKVHRKALWLQVYLLGFNICLKFLFGEMLQSYFHWFVIKALNETVHTPWRFHWCFSHEPCDVLAVTRPEGLKQPYAGNLTFVQSFTGTKAELQSLSIGRQTTKGGGQSAIKREATNKFSYLQQNSPIDEGQHLLSV